MTKVADVANVVVNIADTRITRVGFGVIAILDLIESTVFPERSRQYPDIDAVAADFANTTKVYKMAAAIFNQDRAPTYIKVIRREAGDASITSALDVIVAEDNDFYEINHAFKASAEIIEVAAWCESKFKIHLAHSSDADVVTGVDTDVASLMQASSYNRSAYMWHHQIVDDVTAAAVVVASGVATVTNVGHGLLVGDPITLSGSVTVAVDGNDTVDTVVDVDNFTFLTDAADATGTANYYSGYNFPEAAWAGYMLPSDPGSETWKFKQLVGIQVTSTAHLSPSLEAIALGKNANLYTYLAGVGHTQPGIMASGRFIDIQRTSDWTEARIEEAIVTLLLNQPKVPYSDAGFTAFYAEIAAVFDLGVKRGALSELLDGSGDFYRIVIPKATDQLTADRQNRYLPGITCEIQIAGAVHSTLITVNATI